MSDNSWIETKSKGLAKQPTYNASEGTVIVG